MFTTTNTTIVQCISTTPSSRVLNKLVSRSISLLNKLTLSQSSPITKQLQTDLDKSINLVRQYDPVGYLPGLLLPSDKARLGYFAIRSFWVETGLRLVKQAEIDSCTPSEKLSWWRESIQSLYDQPDSFGKSYDNPIIRLLHHTLRSNNIALSNEYFNSIILSREMDLELKQYSTVQSLIDHSKLSCGSLLKLVLQCSNVSKEANPLSYQAADCVGIAHGITNSLRGSIPIASITGRIIIPEELCLKYGVKSPRYLLSALGQGDKDCEDALKSAVRDLSLVAREYLVTSRSKRDDILQAKDGSRAVAVLLPGLSSEVFLNRLEKEQYDLSSRDLREIGYAEHLVCAARMIYYWLNQKY